MKTPALIVELAGPAGSGKSTLTTALSKQPGIRVGKLPDVRNPKYALFFAWNLFLLIPTFFTFNLIKNDRRLQAREMAFMAILKGWNSLLGQQAKNSEKMVILDQGPIYLLAELLRFGPGYIQERAAKKWWDVTCQHWAKILDVVVCIDTDDVILIDRIRNRGKSHGIKKNCDEWAVEFLSYYRWAQEKVLSAFAEQSDHPDVLRFDTALLSLDETIANILAINNNR